MHETVQKIRSLLESHNISYRYMEHEPGITSRDMVEIRKDFSLAEGAKALILATDNTFIQIVVPGDKKFSNSKVRKLLNTNRIRFATAEELADITNGILPGAVPPFGSLFNLSVYADEDIFKNERIVFNCGERTASISMSSSDYRSIVNPTVGDISE